MSGQNIQIYKRAEEKQRSVTENQRKPKFEKKDIFYAIITFLLSRAKLFGQLTPFGAAFYAAAFSASRMPLGVCGVLFGCITAGSGIRTLQYIVCIGFFTLFKYIFDKESAAHPYLCAAMAGIGNFVGCLLVSVFQGFNIYNLLLDFTESVLIALTTALFIGVYAIRKCEYSCLKIVSRDDMLGIVLLLGLSVCGITDFVDFGVVNLCEIIWSVLILTFAYVGGVSGGLGSGVMIGLVSAMNASDPLSVIGLYCACGLAAGLAQRLGKIGVSAVYLSVSVGLGVSTTLFVFGYVGLVNILIASLVFAVLPNLFFDKHFAFAGDVFTPHQQKVYSGRLNALLSEKFQSLANVFSGLSETVERLSENKKSAFSLQSANAMEPAAYEICKKCSMYVYCWEKESEKTTESFGKAMQRLQKKGYIDVLDFPETFQKNCIQMQALVANVNHTYTLNRLNAIWDNQLSETRFLLGQQYRDFAEVMQGISKDITQKVVCESSYKTNIKAEMEEMGYALNEVYLYMRPDENYDIELQFATMDTDISVQDIERAVSESTKRAMRVSVIDEYNLTVRLEPQFKFAIGSSIATLKKDGETENGDSYAVFHMKDNRCAMILSDGMGSGKRASAESASAVELLKKLLLVGFEVKAAVQLVNSALVLKAGDESFATIDLAIVDLLKGEVSFIKIGAARSYIKYKKNVEAVKCTSLPVGILSETEIRQQTKTLHHGDCIIMLSDGITDTAEARDLEGYIDSLSSASTEEMAKSILQYALSKRKGVANDDLTVIVTKIAENK